MGLTPAAPSGSGLPFAIPWGKTNSEENAPQSVFPWAEPGVNARRGTSRLPLAGSRVGATRGDTHRGSVALAAPAIPGSPSPGGARAAGVSRGPRRAPVPFPIPAGTGECGSKRDCPRERLAKPRRSRCRKHGERFQQQPVSREPCSVIRQIFNKSISSLRGVLSLRHVEKAGIS